MEAASYILFACWVFWHFFIHSQGLYRAKLKGRLVGLPLVLSLPVVAFTFLIDLVAQFTLASLFFWEWPKGVGLEKRKFKGITVPWPVGDWLVTYRLRRYIAAGPSLGIRFKVADALCKRWLDPFDPTGAHCDSDDPRLAEFQK